MGVQRACPPQMIGSPRRPEGAPPCGTRARGPRRARPGGRTPSPRAAPARRRRGRRARRGRCRCPARRGSGGSGGRRGAGRLACARRAPRRRTGARRSRPRRERSRGRGRRVAARADHDHRDVAVPGAPGLARPQPATQLEPGGVGQDRVQQDEIGSLRLDELERRGGPVGGEDLEAVVAQLLGEERPRGLLVLDYQDGFPHAGDASNALPAQPDVLSHGTVKSNAQRAHSRHARPGIAVSRGTGE